jgi:hypothetical protein
MKFDPFTTGLRVLDIEHGLRPLQPTPIVETELGNTQLLGKAANLGLHLRELNVVNYKPLVGMAAELGVRTTELRTVLRELEEIGWVRLVGKGTKIDRIEILVPGLRPGFEVIGERWRSLGPSEIEQASVTVLSDAIIRPFARDDLLKRHGLSKETANIVLEIGDDGTFLMTERLNSGEQIVYSPLYGDNNPIKAFEVVRKYGDQKVVDLMSRIQAFQGMPLDRLAMDASLVYEAQIAGILLTPAVKDKQFVFTFQHGTDPEEIVILDKARAILSCVRYGEHFADVTKIMYPAAILRTLIDNKKLTPHSEHLKQYGLLVTKGIGRVDQVGSRYQFSVLDTPDNMKALRTALDILRSGIGIDQALDDTVPARILGPDKYRSPATERTRLHRSAKGGKASYAKSVANLSKLVDIVRGATNE